MERSFEIRYFNDNGKVKLDIRGTKDGKDTVDVRGRSDPGGKIIDLTQKLPRGVTHQKISVEKLPDYIQKIYPEETVTVTLPPPPSPPPAHVFKKRTLKK